jgi:hypothetical protein
LQHAPEGGDVRERLSLKQTANRNIPALRGALDKLPGHLARYAESPNELHREARFFEIRDANCSGKAGGNGGAVGGDSAA